MERVEPSGTSTVLASATMFEGRNYTVLIRGVDDFQVREDFMFATRRTNAVCVCAKCHMVLQTNFIITLQLFSMKVQRTNLCRRFDMGFMNLGIKYLICCSVVVSVKTFLCHFWVVSCLY